MPQTAVSTAPAVGLPGEPADMHSSTEGRVVSRLQAETTNGIVPGIMVQRGTGDYDIKRLTATTNKLEGITVRTHDVSDLDFDFINSTGYKPGAEVPVARTERWFVKIEENVTPASDVRVRCVAVGNEVAGAFRATADSTDCMELTAFAHWVRTALAADGVGELEIDMNMADLAVAD